MLFRRQSGALLLAWGPVQPPQSPMSNAGPDDDDLMNGGIGFQNVNHCCAKMNRPQFLLIQGLKRAVFYKDRVS